MQKILIYICFIVFGTRCAQITPLTGGKKDINAPKPLTYFPENASLQFNSKTIDIVFDEYIVLKDIANQFIITPQTKQMPEISASGKKLKIIFSDTLLPNTTYKLAFGNAISDVNESNVLQNFEYVFSTGQNIDSLKLNGQVINAYTKKPESKILIGLFPASSIDSAIYKTKPKYITKTNDNGEFNFNYLPKSTYKIFAIKDQNKNLVYDGSEEQLGFLNEAITAEYNKPLNILLFKEITTKNFIKKHLSPEYGKVVVVFSKPQLDFNDVKADGMVSYELNRLKDSLTIYFESKYDTLTSFINYTNHKTDTLYTKILYEKTLTKQFPLLKYTLQSNIQSTFPYFQSIYFQLNVPVISSNINESKLILKEKKDTTWIDLPFTIVKENGLITDFKIKAEINPERNYKLIANKGLVTSKNGRQNDSLNYLFKTTEVDDYAQLNLKLFFPKKETYLVLLLNDKEQIIEERVVEFSLTSTSEKIIEYKNLFPGNYFIKVVEDANKNRLFDTGDYFSNKQPETIYINNLPIKLLAGWEIENEWIVK